MTPEYLENLADAADPEELWRLPLLEHFGLSADKRKQLDIGVALRRQADHVRRLRELIGTGNSLLITPLSENGVATKIVPMPESHQKLLAPRLKPNARVQAGLTAPQPDPERDEAARRGASPGTKC